MQHVLKAPKVKLSIVINVFFSPAAVVVQSSLTFQSSTWQELGLARSANTHYVAARSESLCLIHQSSQLFRDGTLLNGPMPLILHLAKKTRWFFFPPTPNTDKKLSPVPSWHPHGVGSDCAEQAAHTGTSSHSRCCCSPSARGELGEGKEGGMAPGDSALAPGKG